MKRFAVIISGCGNIDGAEIHESVMTLLAIDKLGAEYRIFAPDVYQHHVIDHYRKKPMPELRNVLVESARIARGDIQALSEYKPDDFDALVMPGGMGAAKNLCNYHKKGADMKIIPEVKAAIINTHKLRKPIGALCIAPVMLAKLIPKVTITMGASEDAEKMTAAMGATNIRSTHGDVVIDTINNVFTTPCYMLDASIKDIAEGAENLIAAMLKKLNE